MKKLLGDYQIHVGRFSKLESAIKKLKSSKTSVDRERSEEVNRTLLELIQKEEEPCFLLPAVLEFVERIDSEDILHHYTFTSFELWLNQFSGLKFEDNFRIRAKIAGKRIDRGAYQALFPIGMGKVYEGTHFVTAHKAPDLDTTIASFWGWVDAFAAKVGDGLHIWNLPDGPPAAIEIDWIFRDVLGAAIFTHLPKTRTTLSLLGNDLMNQRGLICKKESDSIADIDHERDQNATVVVDDEGFYLGDWRSSDSEGVRQVIILLSSCLRWFESKLQVQLISLFSKKSLELSDVETSIQQLLSKKVKNCEPAEEFSHKQRNQVDQFLKLVLHVKEGLDSDFDTLAKDLCKLSDVPYGALKGLIKKMEKGGLFDSKGKLIDDRPQIFTFLEEVIEALHLGILQIRKRMEKLDIALSAKFQVFKHSKNTITVRSDVEEIRNKMGHYSYLTVVYPDKDRLFPVGVVQAQDLRKGALGTVSLRDFCNRDEMGIPDYLNVISVIDHHKTVLNTFAPPMAILSDVQSSNTLVAQKAFEINDVHSFRGQSEAQVERQIEQVSKKSSSENVRLLQRLLNKRLQVSKTNLYFIHQDREYLEYLHFLYGIIDDTDLLTKVSVLDVECVASLLNRMKSIVSSKEVEVVSLDDLPRDRSFPKKAAARILQNEDMYSLYAKVYQYREKEVEKNISLCAEKKESDLFADTKEQNGCCRVGQTKMFAANLSFYNKQASKVREAWLQKALNVYKEKPEIDLHIHMISTIVNADEVYRGTVGNYSHQDELWIWSADTETGSSHLRRFLNAFQDSPGVKDNELEVEFLGNNSEELSHIFTESFLDIPQKVSKKDMPIIVLKYKAGTMNSRKSMISPFLPKLR